MLPNLVEKTNQRYVLLVIAKCVYATTNFDLGHMSFFHWLWIPWNKIGCLNTIITISLFEAFETSRQALARNLQDFLKQCGLTNFCFFNVKHEDANLNTMITILRSIVTCETLGVTESFQGTYFGHAFFKACQYVIVGEKVSRGFKYVFVRYASKNLQTCITWHKKLGKGRHESWMKACITIGLKLKKFSTLVKTKYNANYFVFFPFIIWSICIPKCCILIDSMGAIIVKGATYNKV